jgi:hypothetical protein
MLTRGSGSRGAAAAKGIAPPHNLGSHLPAGPSSIIRLSSERFLRISCKAFSNARRNPDDKGSRLVRSLSDSTAISREKFVRREARAIICAFASKRSASLMVCSRRPSLPWTHRSDNRLASKACLINSSWIEVDGSRGAAGVTGKIASIFAKVFFRIGMSTSAVHALLPSWFALRTRGEVRSSPRPSA